MGYDHITANWARQQSETVISNKVQKEIDACLSAIATAVASNETYAYLNGYLHDLTKQELTKRGFKLTYNEGDPRDQRECSSYTTKW